MARKSASVTRTALTFSQTVEPPPPEEEEEVPARRFATLLRSVLLVDELRFEATDGAVGKSRTD
jgi:hypothetical protein